MAESPLYYIRTTQRPEGEETVLVEYALRRSIPHSMPPMLTYTRITGREAHVWVRAGKRHETRLMLDQNGRVRRMPEPEKQTCRTCRWHEVFIPDDEDGFGRAICNFPIELLPLSLQGGANRERETLPLDAILCPTWEAGQ